MTISNRTSEEGLLEGKCIDFGVFLLFLTYSLASRKGCGLLSDPGDCLRTQLPPPEGGSSHVGEEVTHNVVGVVLLNSCVVFLLACSQAWLSSFLWVL